MDRTVRAVIRICLFYVSVLACIWILKRARSNTGRFLRLDKCHEKVYI